MLKKLNSPIGTWVQLVVLGLLAVLWVVNDATGAKTLPEAGDRLMYDVRDTGPNEVEKDLMIQNYYEQVLDFDRTRFATLGGLGDALEGGPRPGWGPIDETDFAEKLPGEFLFYRLIPGAVGTHKDAEVRVNEWGMRSRPCTKEKPAGTCRIALVGASNSMGSGVEMDKNYASLLEDHLNAELGGKAYERYEVLNFSIGGYQLLSRAYQVEQIVPQFEPDLILFTTHVNDIRKNVYSRLARRVAEERDLHFDFLKRVAEEENLSPTESRDKMERRLRPHRFELVDGAYSVVRETSEREHIPAVILVLRLETGPMHNDYKALASAAAAALPTIELYDAYEDQNAEEMYLVPGEDNHPTVLAHSLLADELYDDLLADPMTRAIILGEKAANTPNGG